MTVVGVKNWFALSGVQSQSCNFVPGTTCPSVTSRHLTGPPPSTPKESWYVPELSWPICGTLQTFREDVSEQSVMKTGEPLAEELAAMQRFASRRRLNKK